MQVGIIIPARNEADALGRVLAEIPRALVREILVVDNGSTDGTASVARHGGARVVAEPIAGYGRACLAGLSVLSPSVDVVVFLDGDHSDDAAELPTLLAPIASGEADLVIGSRVGRAEPGSLTLQQRVGNRLACFLIDRFLGFRYTDLGPFRAIRREALARLRMQDPAFGWTVEMQAKAARQQLRIIEVPVRYRRRIGRSKISGTLSGSTRAGIGILSTIVKVALEPAKQVGTQRLLIFLKAPTPGTVKTRLALDVGPEAAGALYRACVELTLERLARFQREAVLCVDPPQALAQARDWLGPAWRYRPQQGAELGERLAEATAKAFAEGATRVVVIGTDAPWLDAEDIASAFQVLERADVVLGPTDDGGYYLIGLSHPTQALFENVSWSSSSVFEQTRATASALGLRVEALRPGYDLDHLSDVERFIAEEHRKGTASNAVATMEALSHRRESAWS